MKTFTKNVPDSSSSPSASPPSSQPIVVAVTDKPRGLPLRDWIDQTAGAETFELLSEADIAKLRENYFNRTGSHPDPTETPSDEQLSAMAHWLRPGEGARVRPPFAEFAVFVPYAGRAAKMRPFSAMVLDRDGSWAQRSLKGPSNFGQWEACWGVYATTLVMLDVATPGALKTYFQAFRRLCQLFPQDWGTLVGLEEQVRAEEWNLARQEIARGLLSPPPNYNVTAPWQTIIPASRPFYSAGLRFDWWQERITVLEWARSSKPVPGAGGAVPAVLPSMLGQPAIPELVGASSSSRVQPPPNPHPGNFSRNQQKKQNKQNANNLKRKSTELGPCFNCGQMGHEWKHCLKPKGKGKGEGKNKNNSKA